MKFWSTDIPPIHVAPDAPVPYVNEPCGCEQSRALQAELAACHSALLAPVHQDPRAKDAEAMLARIAAIVNAHHNGDDGELTPGQSRTIALAAIADVLGEPF